MRTTRLLAATAACALGTAALAQETLTLSHWVPGSHPLQTTGMEPWAESIAEASEGRITVEIYPAQQLGAAPDHYDLARDGIVDIAFINPGYQPGRFPVIAAGELPFLIENAKGGSRALHEWYLDYAEQEMSDVYVCMVHLHDPGTFHAKEGPMLTPSDVEGANVRPAHATMARFVNLLGGASVQVPAPEMREALSKGTADMTTFPWGSLFIFGAEDIVKHHLDIPLYVTTFAFVMNKDRIDGLAPEDRAVIDDHCTPEWSERIASPWADAEAEGRQRIIDLGDHTLYTPTEDEMQAWRDAAAPLTEEWRASVSDAGVDADAAYQGLIDTLQANDALVE
jgi:TRAP-type C4-dicarboxylate transport system substrate-binding protein